MPSVSSVPALSCWCRRCAALFLAPLGQTCHRRFQQWVRSGVMKGVLEALAQDLKVRGGLNVEEAFIDGSFAPAKKGALRSGKRSAEKEPRSWQWPIEMAFPS